MYHDLMNLYGDWANAAILERELMQRGHDAVVDKKSVGDDVDFDAYDFVYIGSGTERSLYACLKNLERYKDAFIGRIEDGMHVLATGNSHELFGRLIRKADGEPCETLGLLDFETIHRDSRVTGDCVCRASFLNDRLVGFINRAGGSQSGSVERPFFLELGPSADDGLLHEGIKYKNLLGTYLTGPILVRNPPLLRYIADKLTNSEFGIRSSELPGVRRQGDAGTVPLSSLEKAYRSALGELSARIHKRN